MHGDERGQEESVMDRRSNKASMGGRVCERKVQPRKT